MPTPEEKIATYKRQVKLRATWFLSTTAIGAAIALLLVTFDLPYPPWRAGLLVQGLLFWPWFYWHVHQTVHISTLQAVRKTPTGGVRATESRIQSTFDS